MVYLVVYIFVEILKKNTCLLPIFQVNITFHDCRSIANQVFCSILTRLNANLLQIKKFGLH